MGTLIGISFHTEIRVGAPQAGTDLQPSFQTLPLLGSSKICLFFTQGTITSFISTVSVEQRALGQMNLQRV